MDRLDLYLHKGGHAYYSNTEREQELVTKFNLLFTRALSWQQKQSDLSPTRLDYYRRAYTGELGALDMTTGRESKREMRQLRKLVYEMIESKIDNSVPLPKMVAKYKSDKHLVDVTESFMKTELDNILAKYMNDASERATYIDGTTWYKVYWDPMASSHDHNGSVRIQTCLVDEIVPQPNVVDYKQLEYIFEIQHVSTTRLYDLYGRLITPLSDDSTTVDVIYCYYLNENHIVGLFAWARHSLQVVCNEHDWQIRKVRTCKHCGTINPTQIVCGNCGHTHFKYTTLEDDILEEDLIEIINPYDVQEQQGQQEQQVPQTRVFATAGTKIPYYKLRQLPFVPRPAISSLNSIYGISEVKCILEEQDATNKLLTKAVDKGMKSGTLLTVPERMKIDDTDATFKLLRVRSAEEGSQVQAKQAMSDVTQDIALANLIYENARNASGVTESYQGQKDSSASSGKAKEFAAAQTAGRIESLRVMKSAAFAGIYELVLKYLLAFSDEPRKFVKVLPNGEEVEQTWNKYMFLAKDNYGEFYYRDDFTFSTDPAATLSQNRVQMWQETQDKFVNGALGNPADPRTIELFWNMMNSFEYPLAKLALAGIKANSQHLPPEVEQALLQNPELLQSLMQTIAEGEDGRGGARPNSGPAGNGATHAANVERTNERNRSQNRTAVVSGQQGGSR